MLDVANTPKSAFRLDALRVFTLGLNLWAVAVWVPLLISPEPPFRSLLVASLGLSPLVVGAWVLARRPTLATIALLAAYPLCLAIAMAQVPQWVSADPYPTSMTVLIAISFVAYGASAAMAATRPRVLATTIERPLVAQIADPSPRKRRVRALVITISALGAFAIGVVAPSLTSSEMLVAHFGESAPSVRVFVAVVAGSIAAGVFGAVAPAMRQARPRPRSGARLFALGAVVLLGAGVYAWVHWAS